MSLHITKEFNKKDKQYIHDELYKFNLKHFPEDLAGRYEEINLFIKDENSIVRGGILAEACWNWLEIQTFMIDEDIRKSGFGTKLLLELEKIALEKECDFIKVDTLSFQALDFYEKNGYQVYGSLDNVGRDYKHYYLKKDLKKF
ncbi:MULTISPECIES: GNAT family N-acetyltransferase [Bacillaceae]|uniref:GNAT family N-acetyltransferase n=1 Tax=Bacillaceae TaxID=186817 RepID=UPI0006FAC25F|nr:MULTISPECIES: GNAT family N-acetyltransferase [Bacillaceae]KQL35310.1 GNAT family acetyltransferase [Psychrobacillus sp. FJAT-21963]MDF2065542.1 GNAT family N-acetyltransferase [Bacillus sp. Cr_A10]